MKPEYNILKNFSSSEFRIVRKRIIEGILATDMTNHSKNLSLLKNKLTVSEINNGENVSQIIENKDSSVKFDNQQLVLNNLLHASDISNPGKISKVYKKWVELVFVEFFYQGDCEKKEKLPISLLCDRETTHIGKSQIGFIKFVTKPTFECIKSLFPEINPYLENMAKNLKMYEDDVKKEELNKQKTERMIQTKTTLNENKELGATNFTLKNTNGFGNNTNNGNIKISINNNS
jgi:hypothetical protein